MNEGTTATRREKSDFLVSDRTDVGVKPNYNFKATPAVILAKFGRDGKTALCGNCGHSLGEFEKVNGTILCKNKNGNKVCYTKNKVVK